MREILRLHSEQRVSRQSAQPDSLAVLSRSSIPPRPADRLTFITAVQALSPLAPALKKPSLQISDAIFFSQPVPESANERLLQAHKSVQVMNGEEDNKRDFCEDTSSALNTSDGDGEIGDSEKERKGQALWTVYPSNYAESVESKATASSIDQERVTASTASRSYATTEKPSEGNHHQ